MLLEIGGTMKAFIPVRIARLCNRCDALLPEHGERCRCGSQWYREVVFQAPDFDLPFEETGPAFDAINREGVTFHEA
jgi:hypothetical protein